MNTFFPTFDVPQKFGLPLTFWETGCYGMTPQGVTARCVNNFSFMPFIGDLIFWIATSYLISCLIIGNKK